MNIYIRGVGTHNKGAELMALAIRDHYLSNELRSYSEDGTLQRPIRLVVDSAYGTYGERAKEGFLVRWNSRTVSVIPSVKRSGTSRIRRIPARAAQILRASMALRMMPSHLRNGLGIVGDKDIDVILDASGFRYSDQWGVSSLIRAANWATRWKRQGKRIILLPQAFGPFKLPGAAAAVRTLMEHCDLVYARDDYYLGYLKEVVGDQPHVKLAPDFTNVLSPSSLDDLGDAPIPIDEKCAIVVPYTRMLDKVSRAQSQNYLAHLRLCVQEARHRGLEIVLMYFDPKDAHFATKLEVDDILAEQDPRVLKAIIRRARVLIGSRFHALVCAFTQGVPAIGSGWSHKYQALFEEYGCTQCLLDVHDPPERVRAAFDFVLDESTRAELISKLTGTEAQVRQRVRAMWQEIDRVVLGSAAERQRGPA